MKWTGRTDERRILPTISTERAMKPIAGLSQGEPAAGVGPFWDRALAFLPLNRLRIFVESAQFFSTLTRGMIDDRLFYLANPGPQRCWTEVCVATCGHLAATA